MNSNVSNSYPRENLPKRTCIKQASLVEAGYKNLEHWLQNPKNVYVGRRGRLYIGSGNEKRIFHYPQSRWGNPYKVKDMKNVPIEKILDLYREYLYKSGIINHIDELIDKNIGCFCQLTERCHTTVLIDILRNKHSNYYDPNTNDVNNSRNNFVRHEDDDLFHFNY